MRYFADRHMNTDNSTVSGYLGQNHSPGNTTSTKSEYPQTTSSNRQQPGFIEPTLVWVLFWGFGFETEPNQSEPGSVLGLFLCSDRRPAATEVIIRTRSFFTAVWTLSGPLARRRYKSQSRPVVTAAKTQSRRIASKKRLPPTAKACGRRSATPRCHRRPAAGDVPDNWTNTWPRLNPHVMKPKTTAQCFTVLTRLGVLTGSGFMLTVYR